MLTCEKGVECGLTRDTNDLPEVSTADQHASNAVSSGATAFESATANRNSSSDGKEAFAGVLQTATDSPVLLGEILGDRFEFVRINGVPIDNAGAASLPGVRVGHGDGSGFVFRRALDGEFVFAPDREFLGTTTFGCTVVDQHGTEATLIARVIVQPDVQAESSVAFSDGSTHAIVKKGSGGAILGALGVTGAENSDALTFRVYEPGASSPSDRFLVSGGRLYAVNGLDREQEDAISLHVIAFDGAKEVAAGDIDITIRHGDAPQSESIFIGEDDFFRFLEGVADQHWNSVEEDVNVGLSAGIQESPNSETLIDWLLPLDPLASGDSPELPIPSTGGPFGE